MKNDDKKFKIKLCMLWIFAFTVIIFMISFTSQAEGSADGSLPYKKSQILTYNSFMNNDIIDKLRTLNLPIDDNNYVLMYSDHSVFTQWPQYNNQYDVTYYFFLLPIEDFNSFSSGYNFYNNNLGVNLTSNSYYYYIAVTCDLTSNFDLIAIRTPSVTPYATSLYNSGMFGHIPSIDNVSGFSFTPFTPVYFNQDFYSINDELVLDYTEGSGGVVIGTGHATAPDPYNNVVPGTHILPHQVPTLTINNYTWTTAPTPDLSTLEKTTESIYQYLQWLGSNLTGALNNLVSNIANVGTYIAETIQYYGGLIIDTLQNGINTFYNNMVSLFEPIAENIKGLYEKIEEFADLFINPFDEEQFEEQIDNCQLISRYNELLDNCEVLQQIFNETDETDSFILYIDFENPFADSEHRIIASEINFNWLVPLRPVYRPFLTVFTLIECFVGGFRILGNIIGGKAK